jgi:methionine synthase I (cobalamin-dependent)
MGLDSGEPPESWLLEHPERILQVHQDYVQAGAEVLTTCSFGANRLRLKKASLADQIKPINARAVQLAREAGGDRVWIAGGMGPTGEFFQPHGKLTYPEAEDVFEEQAGLLAEALIDFFLLETHYDLKEVSIALAACQTAAPQIPVAVTMTFNRTPRGFFSVMGDSAAEALKTLAGQGAFLVGSNCTLEAKGMLELASHLAAEVQAPLLFQANAGSPQITPEGIVYPQDAEEFSRYARDMLALGARAIGGCCGTDGRHIRALRKMIDSKR